MGKSVQAVALVLAAILTFGPGLSAAPKLAVKGDAKAWAEISAALGKLTKLKSYRAKVVAAGPSGPMVTQMDFVNPGNFHSKTTVGGSTVEVVQVGPAVRVRSGGGNWICSAQPQDPPNMDPEKMWGEVTASRGAEATIAGVRTKSYTFAWKNEIMTTKTRLFVAVADVLPRRAEVLNEDGSVVMTTDYYDFDANIKITLPPCK